MRKIVDWIFWQFQKRCKHDGLDVAADILEGRATSIPYAHTDYEVMWCHRCGAYVVQGQIPYTPTGLAKAWRVPRATWTGTGR